jgi:hypothetical protein
MSNFIGNVPFGGLKFNLLAGAAADTDIAVAGINKNSTIVFCLELATTTNDPADRTATTSVTSDGNVQCSVATASDSLLLLWY